jgi:hypothetical protein
MWRRLYLTFPDIEHTRHVSDELQHEGIKQEQMHAMNRDGGDLPGLPKANAEQQHDRVWFYEQLYWYSNLALFVAALLGFAIALATGATPWMFITAAIMLLTFLTGNYFASRIPHAHLNEMQEPLQHGEVVLMVDLPAEQVARIDHEVAHRHPEARGHVVGWIIPGLGI